MKRFFTALTFLLVSAPAMGQTTNCHANVFGRPEYGVTCETQQQPQRQSYRSQPNMGLILEDNVAQQNAIMAQRRAQQQQYDLQQRELALRERELAFRQAQAMARPQ